MKEILTALKAARDSMVLVGKSGRNKFDNYDYATLADYIHATDAAMSQNELLLVVSEVETKSLPPRKTAKGGDMFVCRVVLEGTLYHTSGQSLGPFRAVGDGEDRSDKAPYKATTGARKYLIAQVFNLYTTDDPEREESQSSNGKKAPAPKKEPAARSQSSNGKKFSAEQLIGFAEKYYGESQSKDELLVALDKVAKGRDKFPNQDDFAKAINAVLKYTQTLTDDEVQHVNRKCNFLLAKQPGMMTAAELDMEPEDV